MRAAERKTVFFGAVPTAPFFQKKKGARQQEVGGSKPDFSLEKKSQARQKKTACKSRARKEKRESENPPRPALANRKTASVFSDCAVVFSDD